ncbi:MAG: MFS transporter [Alphaproteobacteria bacterium]|nr:MFS transporter [Alphaproteobacteria bacterium]
MSMAAQADGHSRPMTGEEKRVIFASSLGTVFEWYDFYLYGWTAAQIGAAFYSAFDANTQFIFALLTFSAGFLVRPFGALVFGRLGDLVGRKYTFLVTITIMGLSTFLVGLTPSYKTLQDSIGMGWLAPAILIALRLQSNQDGLFMSLLVVAIVRNSMAPADFASATWGGWRIPYLLSIVLLGISIWIRLQLSESPAFQKMKSEGTLSKAPLSEAFGKWSNAKIAIFALLGLTAGQAVIWYGGQFYARIFMVNTLKVDANSADTALIIALLIATAGFVFFGWLSDRIGRKPIILAGCLLGAVSYQYAFHQITHYANPALEAALASAPVSVTADPSDCNVLFDPVGGKVFKSSCDIARQTLIGASVNYSLIDAPKGTVAKVKVGTKEFDSFKGEALDAKAFADQRAAFVKNVTDSVKEAGYPAAADPAKINMPMLIVMLVYLAILVTMVYGPIAAALVELFPTRIRYSAMSLPYQGLIFIPETKDRDIYAND